MHPQLLYYINYGKNNFTIHCFAMCSALMERIPHVNWGLANKNILLPS